MIDESWIDKIKWPTALLKENQKELINCAQLLTPEIKYNRTRFKDDYTKGIYYIVEGLATVSFVTLDMKPLIGAALGSNHWFGGMIMHNFPTLTLLINEIESLTLLYFPRNKVEALCNNNPIYYKFLYKITQENQRRLLQNQMISYYSIEKRVAYILLELRFCKQEDKNTPPNFTITQQQVCDVSGLSRSRVNEIFNLFKKEKLIELSRGAIKITDINKLSQKINDVNLELHNPYDYLTPHQAE